MEAVARSTPASLSSSNGLQKGPAERGHVSKNVKKCQKVFRHFSTIFARRAKKESKIVEKCQIVFRHFSTLLARRAKKRVKNRQKVSNVFSTLFGNFRAAPFLPAPFAINPLSSRDCYRASCLQGRPLANSGKIGCSIGPRNVCPRVKPCNCGPTFCRVCNVDREGVNREKTNREKAHR